MPAGARSTSQQSATARLSAPIGFGEMQTPRAVQMRRQWTAVEVFCEARGIGNSKAFRAWFRARATSGDWGVVGGGKYQRTGARTPSIRLGPVASSLRRLMEHRLGSLRHVQKRFAKLSRGHLRMSSARWERGLAPGIVEMFYEELPLNVSTWLSVLQTPAPSTTSADYKGAYSNMSTSAFLELMYLLARWTQDIYSKLLVEDRRLSRQLVHTDAQRHFENAVHDLRAALDRVRVDSNAAQASARAGIQQHFGRMGALVDELRSVAKLHSVYRTSISSAGALGFVRFYCIYAAHHTFLTTFLRVALQSNCCSATASRYMS